MKKLAVILSMVIGFSFPIIGIVAEVKEVQPAVSQKLTRPITVQVNGLVCSFCAQGIKKRFMTLAPVQSVLVSLEKKTVLITLKPNTVLSDQMIQSTVKDAGYVTVRIER